MKRRSVKLAVLGALATCALVAGPLASQASAIKTKIVAHSIVADVNDVNLQGNVPLRPSAHVTRRDTGAPVANRFVAFWAPSEGQTGLCAEKTNNFGYAECKGIVRVTHPALALGKYEAVFPAQGDFERSTDFGQLATIGTRVSLLS